MLRPLFALIAACAIIAVSTLGALALMERRQESAALAGLRARIEAIDREQLRWHSEGSGSLAQADLADEAYRTLDLLEELYRQEEQLWTYYDALEHSRTLQRQFIDERRELEQLLHQRRRQLEALERSRHSLRPDPGDGRLSFTAPRRDSHPID
ncbi:MAG: hypothetical protein ACOCYP_08275 [Planctomycetota bacterium]